MRQYRTQVPPASLTGLTSPLSAQTIGNGTRLSGIGGGFGQRPHPPALAARAGPASLQHRLCGQRMDPFRPIEWLSMPIEPHLCPPPQTLTGPGKLL